jgi:hypothetical protein
MNDLKSHFDEDFYRSKYPDVDRNDIDCLKHYCIFGWREGRDPRADFSTTTYLDLYKDVADADINPFWHYIVSGRKEGRVTQRPNVLLASTMDDLKNHFDEDFYRNKYPDIESNDIDSLKHYCIYGWREGRDPRADFSTTTYLDFYRDIVDADINPFWHYIVAGRKEGRVTQHPGGIKAEILKKLLPLNRVVQQFKKNENPPELLTEDNIEKFILNNNFDPTSCIVISISHDNYKNIIGGTQLCVQIEEQQALQQGWTYLNIHPWQPLPVLASASGDNDPLVVLVLNGQVLGCCYSSVLTRAVQNIIDNRNITIYTIIHSLLGHSIDHVKKWVNLNKNKKCWIWLHDFFTLCPNYSLQRNNISFCNAPELDSNACNICNYGDERVSHLEQMKDLFINVSATIISPSEFTKKLWLSKLENHKYQVIVLPHMELKWTDCEKHPFAAIEKPISIGYLGIKAYHKGWNIFEKLVNTFGDNAKFKFYYFGNQIHQMTGVQNINVSVSSSDPLSMVNAVAEIELDFVLNWAMWPETFSFTAHEAIVGGAHVLTNTNSGNVASIVSKTEMGTIFNDENELFSFFSLGMIDKTTKKMRSLNATRDCHPSFSEMTIPFLIKEHTL